MAQEVGHLGSWELDLATQMIWGSEEAFRLYGLERGDGYVSLAEVRALRAPADAHRVDAALEAILRGERPYDEEFTVHPKDGSPPRVLHTVATLKRDEQGNPVGLFGVIQDVTHRNDLESQLRHAQKMEAVGRLAGGVAHDFNNMLTVILSYGALALEGLPGEDPLRVALDEITRAAERAAELTRQLLAFSRRQVLQPQVLDLNDAVTGTDRMLRRVLGEDIRLRTVTAPDLRPVKADRGQVEQVVMNLAVNARDAMATGGKLTIETANVDLDADRARELPGARPGAYVRLAMTDTGTGMSDETLAHAFEPFFTTKDAGKGTGLGLATVLGIVQQSGGFVAVRSEPGKGTTFEVYLPTCDAESEAPGATPAAAQARATGETVLVADDEQQVRQLLQAILQRQGYHVLVAATPGAAVTLARGHVGRIHLLLTDVVMPAMDGRQLAEQIMADRPEVKVLFMSGYAGSVVAARGVLEDGAAFVAKPLRPAALLAKIREVLGAPAPPATRA